MEFYKTNEGNFKEISFLQPKSMGPRGWGKENLLNVNSSFSLKLLSINKGSCGGLQYHHKKDEIGYVVKGKLLIKHCNKKGELVETMVQQGEFFHFPPGAIHQEIALTDVEIIEVSTPYKNDRVRMEEFFGMKLEDTDSDLPSTDISQVEKIKS